MRRYVFKVGDVLLSTKGVWGFGNPFIIQEIKEGCMELYDLQRDCLVTTTPIETRWLQHAFESIPDEYQTAISAINTQPTLKDYNTLKAERSQRCSCDLYSVLLPIGCQCGGK